MHRPLFVTYVYVSNSLTDCIILSSLVLNLILLTSSADTLCFLLLSLCYDFNINLLLFMIFCKNIHTSLFFCKFVFFKMTYFFLPFAFFIFHHYHYSSTFLVSMLKTLSLFCRLIHLSLIQLHLCFFPLGNGLFKASNLVKAFFVMSTQKFSVFM